MLDISLALKLLNDFYYRRIGIAIYEQYSNREKILNVGLWKTLFADCGKVYFAFP